MGRDISGGENRSGNRVIPVIGCPDIEVRLYLCVNE